MNYYKRLHNFDIITVGEPLVSGDAIYKFKTEIKFSDGFRVEDQGKLSGLWILWTKKKIDKQVLQSSKHCFHFIVDDKKKVFVITYSYLCESQR